MPQLERVFVDTATLYPVSLADLVLRLAEFGTFELLWSDHLLAEVERVLGEHKGLAEERLLLLRVHSSGVPRRPGGTGGLFAARGVSEGAGARWADSGRRIV